MTTYIGLDFSTQRIKLVAVNDDLKVVYENSVTFESDLPEFRTENGAHIHEDNVTVTSPTLMWVKALDLLLEKMKADGFQFSSVKGISGDGQQHGSVYWKKGSKEVLKNLDPLLSLHEQLQDCFSIQDSPIWMDSSTEEEIKRLESHVGGPMRLAEITGARGFARYTGSQIMKIAQKKPELYDNTERISLVSSFAASLFIGDYAPIDYADGSGMNLLDINTKDWSPECLQVCGKNLAEKLGQPIDSSKIVGQVSSYLSHRYGFPKDCCITAFTGDNPASLAGLAPKSSDAIVSLGTSSALFLWLKNQKPGLDGHIFVNPVNSSEYMALVCFKNGALTRESIKNECADGSWDKFSDMLSQTPPGNNGSIGIYFDVTEIQPVASGRWRFDADGNKVDSFPKETEVRAVVESQFLAARVYAERRGMHLSNESRIIATGGTSSNTAILQVLADVFGAAVFVTDVPNSAALGGCYRAKCGSTGLSFEDVMRKHAEPECKTKPNSEATQVYNKMIEIYTHLEKTLTS